MQYKINVLFLAGVLSCSTHAGTVLDVYGVDKREADDLLKRFSTDIKKLEAEARKEIKKIELGAADTRFEKELVPAKQSLMNRIKNTYQWAHVDFQTVIYPGEKNTYTTVEVVKESNSPRYRFINEIKQEPRDERRGDLIDKMRDYINLTVTLPNKKILKLSQKPCPVYHCILGFDDPELKPYWSAFQEGVTHNKAFILKTLASDPNVERRGAAAFLVGHFQNPHEILAVLSPYIQDKDSLIRNNVMRVIGATIDKAKIDDIALDPVFELLDAPNVTDRNKALYILYSASKLPNLREELIQKGASSFIRLLALKQLNNHGLAYHILVQISGKHYGERNLSAWNNWLKTVEKKQA